MWVAGDIKVLASCTALESVIFGYCMKITGNQTWPYGCTLFTRYRDALPP